MSQRMTDERWAYLRRFGTLGPNVFREARDELDRARSEEARLLEENRVQSEQIKALADALEAVRREKHTVGVESVAKIPWSVSVAIDAALRLCGRLK